MVDHLPVGLQIIGPHFAEGRLLNVAHRFQQQTAWHRRPRMSEAAWESVIGLEIHAQLATESKIFSGTPTRYGAAPNTQANLVDLGYPGTLPVLNGQAVFMAVKFGLATGSTIAPRSVFARKNYFYPDLPKGYQISQYELPWCRAAVSKSSWRAARARTIGITRAHLEEDAGKIPARGLSWLERHRSQSGRYTAAGNSLRAAYAIGRRSGCLHEAYPHPSQIPGNL